MNEDVVDPDQLELLTPSMSVHVHGPNLIRPMCDQCATMRTRMMVIDRSIHFHEPLRSVQDGEKNSASDEKM